MKNLPLPALGNLGAACFLLAFSGTAASAQSFSVGSLEIPSQPFSEVAAIYTVINVSHGATRDGEVRTVTLLWSAAPCPAAFKIKQFRPTTQGSSPGFAYIDERGPFDIKGMTSSTPLPSPLHFKAGDFLGLVKLTDCGSPMLHVSQSDPGTVYSFPGDLKSDVFPPTTPPHPTESLDLAGYESASTLFLLNNRFAVTVSLTDPRTGNTATGEATSQSDLSGFFSAPDFTGLVAFPEVVVKMADATSAPPPFGGFFWVFYGSLTDTDYVVTVTDSATHLSKTYVGHTAFCGGADTQAFTP